MASPQRAIVRYLPVHAGPEGKTHVRLEASKRQSPRRFGWDHLGFAFFAGCVVATIALAWSAGG